MYKITFTLVFLCCMISARAEYNRWLLKLSVTQTNGQKLIGYVEVNEDDYDKDSVQFSTYLISQLSKFNYREDGLWLLFKKRIDYPHTMPGGKDRINTYTLINEVPVNPKTIRHIQLLKKENGNYLEYICNDIQPADTVWMKTKPVKSLSLGGYLCGYELYFHEYNPELEKLVKQLRIASKKDQAREEDEAMDPIIKKILKYKVIVIGGCTC